MLAEQTPNRCCRLTTYNQLPQGTRAGDLPRCQSSPQETPTSDPRHSRHLAKEWRLRRLSFWDLESREYDGTFPPLRDAPRQRVLGRRVEVCQGVKRRFELWRTLCLPNMQAPRPPPGDALGPTLGAGTRSCDGVG